MVDDPSAIDPSVIGGAWAAGADVLLGGSSEAADGSSVSYFYYVVAEDGTRSEVTYKVNFVKAQDGETPTEPEEPGKDDETTTPAEDEQKADENKPDEKKSALGGDRLRRSGRERVRTAPGCGQRRDLRHAQACMTIGTGSPSTVLLTRG